LDAAAGIMDQRISEKRLPKDEEETASRPAPTRPGRLANPQSRALRAPWHDPAEQAMSNGPPGEADRWAHALLPDAVPRVDTSGASRSARACSLAEHAGATSAARCASGSITFAS